MIRNQIISVSIAILLLTIVVWGRSLSGSSNSIDLTYTPPTWTQQQLLIHRAMAGAVPGVAADLAVLHVFNIYTHSLTAPQYSQTVWWPSLYNELRTAQAMDPYFRDVYRLTEGLLAYEAKHMTQAVELLSKSEPYLNSSDPLLVASFIAHQELHDDPLAIELARRASSKPDAQTFTIGYAASLLAKNNSCHIAMQFLIDRLQHMPDKYQQGIKNRIHKLQQNQQCLREFNHS